MDKDLQALIRMWARLGARARAKALSPERRSEIARHASQTRWARVRARKGGKSESAP